MSKHKIAFHIEQDEDGYPGVAMETVWATYAGRPGQYKIGNIPFFAKEATLDDIVQASPMEDGLVFERVVERSSNSRIRVLVYEHERVPGVRAHLRELGCSSELYPSRRYIAVNIPETASLEAVQAYLAELETQDLATYEEPILRQ